MCVLSWTSEKAKALIEAVASYAGKAGKTSTRFDNCLKSMLVGTFEATFRLNTGGGKVIKVDGAATKKICAERNAKCDLLWHPKQEEGAMHVKRKAGGTLLRAARA